MTRPASVRHELRAATAPIHLRLHRHPGLSAAARGAIELADYRQLLMRLYGFHQAFEDICASAVRTLSLVAGSRAGLIEHDLAALGMRGAEISRLPLCVMPRHPLNEGAALGALYVVEGSALGGAQIAQALAPVVGEARRFFLGCPSRRDVWPNLLARLDALAPEAQRIGAIEAAVETFHLFEDWMQDWRAPSAYAGRAPIDARCETKGEVPT